MALLAPLGVFRFDRPANPPFIDSAAALATCHILARDEGGRLL